MKPWLDMIIKLNKVFVNDIDIKMDYDDNDIIQNLDKNRSIDYSKKNYINEIPNNPALVLEHPSSVFLLNIDEKEAMKIQKDYGVICQSKDALDYTPLTQPNRSNELKKGRGTLSWEMMISQYKELPSNSVLIIDRYLFHGDRFDEKKGCYDEQKRNGIKNLYEILKSMLPSEFEGTYHVGIFTTDIDEERIDRKSKNRSTKDFTNLTNNQIISAINKLNEELNRNYVLNIEVVLFNPRLPFGGYDLIHNRRIISNYFIVTADHLLATLNNGKGKSECSQTIGVFPLFENIDKDSKSDKKVERIKFDLDCFRIFIEEQSKKKNPAVIYQNTNIIISTQIMHRFLH